MLLLLDLTEAFNTVDQNIILSQLEMFVSLKVTVLQWFCSYMCGRIVYVNMGTFFSGETPLICNVPHGLNLSPALFALCMLPLGSIFFLNYKISFHCFADDCILKCVCL